MRLLAQLLLAAWAGAEIIDQTAVTVDRQVITTSGVEEQIRISAFLDTVPVDLSAANRRRMAERLIEQALIRREMRISRYPMPSNADADSWIARLRRQRPSFEAQLRTYGLTQSILHRNLLLQLAALRFIDLRFRPGAAVTEGEVELYYRETFIPGWRERKSHSSPPELDDARDEIETTLVQQRIDQALDTWLREARTQARIEFFDEVFR